MNNMKNSRPIVDPCVDESRYNKQTNHSQQQAVIYYQK
jgi:hypothetical protein